MRPREVVAAVAREIVPPPHVRSFLVEAVIPTAEDIARVREAVIVIVIAVAVVALLLGRSS